MRKNYTLLYTDVVDSTAVNSRLGDTGMALLWNEHDRRSRELLRQWRGSEIDRSDGFLALFDSPSDALAFALAYHRMLTTLPVPLRARAGMHVGPLVKRESTASDVQLGAKPVEVVGIAKAVASRLMALALGGQTLLSPQAHASLRAESEAVGEGGPWRSVSHGHWRMKGLEQVVEVFEVGDEHSAFVPPTDNDKSQRMVQMRSPGAAFSTEGTWVSVRDVPHNLPAERDSFVGRAEQLKTLAQAFTDGARLLTISGPGGMGKTRLSLRYAWSWLGDHPGGVWFCDLASARGPDGLLHAVGQGLDVPLGPDALGQLGRAIAGHGQCLIILDNFEQLRRHARDTLGVWLDAAPQARFIVTSREVLGITGERTLALASLETEDAAALFHQRARAAHAEHDAATDADATRELVDLLDGLPLAIELAAPRVRVMRTPELLARMGDRFRLLAGASGRPDRQSTLRATLAWSWDLLSPDERSVLAQLSVFEGGFAWPAVQAVVQLRVGLSELDDQTELSGADDEDAPWIIDLLQSLVDKSLVAPRLGARFKLLRSVQEFAAQQLLTERSFHGAGPGFDLAVRRRHRKFFAAWDEKQATAARGEELDNLVRACQQAIDDSASEDAVTCLRLAWAVLRLTGPINAALQLAHAVAALPMLPPLQRAGVEWVAGHAQSLLGDSDTALNSLARGLEALAQLPPVDAAVQNLMARLHNVKATIRISRREFVAAAEHLNIAQQQLALCDAMTQCSVLNALGVLAHRQDQLGTARQHYQSALQTAFTAGDSRWQSALLGNLAGLLYGEGKLEAARASYEQSLTLALTSGDRRWEGDARCNLGQVHHDQGRLDEAEAQLQQSLKLALAIGHARLAHTVTCNLGLVAQKRGDLEAARHHFLDALARAQACADRHSERLYQECLDKAMAEAIDEGKDTRLSEQKRKSKSKKLTKSQT